jgi:autotransporter translocation and assembly factor TamB
LVLKTGDSSVNLNGLVSFPDEAASEIILKQEKMSIASYFSNYIKVLKNFRIPLDLKVKSSNLKVSDFFSLIDNKVQIKGLIDLNLNISGFLDSPMLSGSCFAKNVMLVLDILKQPIEISDLAVKGKNNRFNIESSGLVRENEQIQSTGEILLDLTGVRGILKKFNLSFILKGYKFRGNQGIRKDFKKEISFAGIIDSKVNVSGEYDDFFIDSEVIVSNSALSFSLSEKKPVQVPGFLNDRVKLKIKLGKNVWFRNNIISTELDGDFQAGVHESELVLNGKIHLLRGKFNYFSNEFDIIEGHIRLNMLMESSDETDFYNLSTADLGLNLDLGRLRLKKTDFSIDTKRHQISLIKGDADIDKRSSININLRGKTNLKGVDIYTVITGSMEDLQMSFYSDPPQDQVYIETLLTRGELLTVSSDPKRSGQDAINLMGAELTNALWKKFSFSLAENFNLSEFSIKSSSNRSGGFKGPAVQFGKYLDDDLYFSYKRIFAEENEETLGLEYHFRRRVILDTELKRNQESDDFTMGLKFKRSF